MTSIKVGDRVRVKEGCQSAIPGETFTVTRIIESPNPYTWDGREYRDDPSKPDWYAGGEDGGPGSNGVWAQFLELVDYSGAVDQLLFDYESLTLRGQENDALARIRAGLTYAYEHGWNGVNA